MLIEFSVENFRSIRDEVRLSLAATASRELRETHVVEPELVGSRKSVPLVPSVAVYGANASGKTNLLRAIGAMREVVVRSARAVDEPLPVTPFKFDSVRREEPTTFELVCVADGVRYQYGFSAKARAVIAEWLFAWPRGRVQLWFERNADEGGGKHSFAFGSKFVGDKEVWRRATRPDALFLSTAIALNAVQLQPLFRWFANKLHVASFGGWTPGFSLDCCREGRDASVLRFLQSTDIAVESLRVVEEKFSLEMLPEDMPPRIREEMLEDLEGSTVTDLRLGHPATDGGSVELELQEESDGTQKMFALAGPWIDTLEKGHVVVIDELQDNLHPLLVRHLVSLFHDPETNPKGAQLVFSTHDTSILNQQTFRRDQIWFCERNTRQETSLFPLNDFRPRKGVENLERSYLAGRYGALPFVRTELTEAR